MIILFKKRQYTCACQGFFCENTWRIKCDAKEEAKAEQPNRNDLRRHAFQKALDFECSRTIKLQVMG